MISELFSNAKVYGRYVRTCKYDGPKSWSKIKEFILDEKNKDNLDTINKILGNWNIQIKLSSDSEPTNNLELIYDYLHVDLKISGDYTDIQDNQITKTWLKYHYALQPITIPKNNPLTLDKLLQIGFNLGRLSVEIDDFEFYGKFIDFYNLNQMDNLNTYIKISQEHEKQIDSNPKLNQFVSSINDFIIEVIGKLQTCSLDELNEELEEKKSNNLNNSVNNYERYKNKYLNYKKKYLNYKKNI